MPLFSWLNTELCHNDSGISPIPLVIHIFTLYSSLKQPKDHINHYTGEINEQKQRIQK